MMGWLMKLTNPYVILALAVGSLYGLWQWSKHDLRQAKAQIEAADAMIAVATKQVEEAKALNEGNKAAFDAMQREIERQKKIAAKFQADARKRTVSNTEAMKRISDAPATSDGPVAPVLRIELDSLRVVQPGGDTPANGVDQDGDASTAAPVEPDVPAETERPGT
jgi:hypothetical protein